MATVYTVAACYTPRPLSRMDDTLSLVWALGDIAFALALVFTALVALGVTSWRKAPWRTRITASLGAAAVAGAGIVGAAHWKLRTLGEPHVDIERVETTSITSARRWSLSQRRALMFVALSPPHRVTVKRILDRPPREVSPFPPLDDAMMARLRARLRATGDCEHEALLDRRLGDFERAMATTCARPAARREAAEAALATGDAPRAWELIATARETVHDGFDGRLLTLIDRPPTEALAVEPAVPAHERPMWRCVTERLRQHALGDQDAEVWTAALESDSAACRILAATSPARRDPASLRALFRLPVPAQRAWSSALTASRVLLAVDGRLDPVPCLTRRVAAMDGAWIARYPALADTLLRAVRDEGCAMVMDRVWFPAMQARAWNEWGDPERPSLDAFEDLIVGWQLIDGAWDRMRQTLDARFTRSRRATLARSFRASFGPLAAWAVGRLDAAWADGTSWPRGFSWSSVLFTFDAITARRGWDYESMLRAHDIPHYAIDGVKRWDLDEPRVPSHNPALSAWIDYWRTGTFAPPHDAPRWLHDDGMQRVVTAAESDAGAVLRALEAPSLEHAERLAVVAYRLRGDTRIFEAWLRRAWGSFDPFAHTLGEWEDALRTLRTCALRLRLPALRSELEATLTRVRRLRRAGDPFVQIVLDGPRPQPTPEDNEGD